MTYQEIKDKLTQCEVKLQQLNNSPTNVKNSKNFNTAVDKLTVLKESLQKRLTEMDKGVIYTDDEQKAKELSDKGSNVKLTAEAEGYEFSKEETMAIAKQVGKAVAKALHGLGDEVAHMKAHHIEPNSFEIHVEYKKDTITDDFSFYISGDTLHLVDFSFDKEIGDVGVKPSGEAIVHVDVLTNELIKHFKSNMKEGMTDQEWADAQEKERLDQHPEKATIEKIQALIAAQKPKTVKEVVKTTSWSRYKKLKDRGVSVQFVTKDELNPPENRSNTPKVKEASSEEEEKFHKKLDTLVHKTFGKREDEMNEAPEGMYYIKIPKDAASQNKAQVILNDFYGIDYEISDNPDGVVLYFPKEKYDAGMLDDLDGDGVEILDSNIPDIVGEPDSGDTDYTQRRRAEKDYMEEASSEQKNAIHDLQNILDSVSELGEEAREIVRAHFPNMLSKGDAYGVFDFGSSANRYDTTLESFIEDLLMMADEESDLDEDAKERVARAAAAAKELATKIAFGKFDTEHGEMDKGKPNLRKYIARPGSLEEDDIDVGHQDDEPAMLKKDLHDIATYASKLSAQLDKYDNVDGEVDFPHWWQKKVTLARDYMSAAQHYLEGEEEVTEVEHRSEASGDTQYDELIGGIMRRLADLQKYVDANEPSESKTLSKIIKAITLFDEKMAYGENLEEDTLEERSEVAIRNEYDILVGKMKQLAQHYKSAEGEAKAKIVAALKANTARKRELEAELDAKVGGYGAGQEFDDKADE